MVAGVAVEDVEVDLLAGGRRVNLRRAGGDVLIVPGRVPVPHGHVLGVAAGGLYGPVGVHALTDVIGVLLGVVDRVIVVGEGLHLGHVDVVQVDDTLDDLLLVPEGIADAHHAQGHDHQHEQQPPLG